MNLKKRFFALYTQMGVYLRKFGILESANKLQPDTGSNDVYCRIFSFVSSSLVQILIIGNKIVAILEFCVIRSYRTQIKYR